MSKAVDEAIAAVTKAVKRLEKGERNQHGGYSFAGIDDFLEMTGKLCGAEGLNVLMDELDFEVLDEFFSTKNGKVAGLRMKFALSLSKDGDSKGPYHRSIIVPANMGSQAFGAGQSYVLKQFLRATFQIPTGDKGEDIDAHDTGTMAPAPKARAKPEPLKGIMRTRAEARIKFGEIVKELNACGDTDMLEGYLSTIPLELEQFETELPDAWNGDGRDFHGLKAEIDNARKRCAEENK